MIEIIEELHAARELLDFALDRYFNACSTIQSHCRRGIAFDRVSGFEEIIACAANEISLFTSREAKLKHAKAVMCNAANYSPNNVPVNALPSEILSRIFGLVLSEQIYTTDRATQSTDFPKHPDVLSHVCSYWRQVAIDTRTLWSYISLAPHLPVNKRLLARAGAYVVRSGQSPLQIHIRDSKSYPDTPNQLDDEDNLLQFLASIAARISSLELVTPSAWTTFHRSILHSSFVNGVPGMLTRLALSVRDIGMSSGRRYQHFIQAAENPRVQSAERMLLELSEESLEELWLHVTVLRLRNVFPYWTSKAYHGLVELRFCGGGGGPSSRMLISITESQLVSILTASPALRILHFDILIKDCRLNNSPAPVQLEDLEELGLRFMCFEQLGFFLRLLAPGSKMSQVSFSVGNDFRSSISFNDDIKGFFARSNVPRLYVYNIWTLQWVPLLYHLAPRLQVLVLEGFENQGSLDPLSPNEHYSPITNSSIDHLYLLRLHIPSSHLHWMLERYPVRELTLWRTGVSRAELAHPAYMSSEQHVDAIAAQHSLVLNILDDNDPNPIVDGH